MHSCLNITNVAVVEQYSTVAQQILDKNVQHFFSCYYIKLIQVLIIVSYEVTYHHYSYTAYTPDPITDITFLFIHIRALGILRIRTYYTYRTYT